MAPSRNRQRNKGALWYRHRSPEVSGVECIAVGALRSARPAGCSTPGPTSDDASSASLHQYPMLPPSHRPGTIDCRLPPRRGRGRRALLQPGLPLPARPAGGGWFGLPQPRPGSRQLPQVVPGSLLAGRRTSLTPHHVRPHYIWLGACVDRDINIHARRPTGSPPASKFRSLLPSEQAYIINDRCDGRKGIRLLPLTHV